MIPRKFLIGFLVILSVAIGFSHGYVKDLPDQSQIDSQVASMMAEELWEGKLAPNFTLPTLTGDPFDLSEYVGDEIIILNFWATWCGPCREEIPELERYYQEQKEQNVLVVGVNVGESRAKVRPFVRNIDMNFPVVLDQDRNIAEIYQVESFPTTVVIGPEGKVRFYKVGMIRNADAAFSDVVSQHRWRLGDESHSISRQEYLNRQENAHD